MFELLKIKNDIKIDGFHSIYYLENGKNFTKTPETHDFWEIVYVDEGEIIAMSDGKDIKIGQGTVIFHRPNELHTHISNKKDSNNILVISFETKSKAMRYFKNKYFTLDKHSKVLLSLFIEEAKKSLNPPPRIYESKETFNKDAVPFGGLQLLLCYFTEFLINLIRIGESFDKTSLNSENRREPDNSIMELVINKINEEVYSNLTLDDLCEKFMMGKSRLTSDFKDYTGKTPMEYYRNIKIKEAKRLIRKEEKSISEISDMLGYSSIHIFSRAFKKSVGFSPREYQKSVIDNS